jgi:hypothetical protein
MLRIRLSESQQSALECSGIDIFDDSKVFAAWSSDRRWLECRDADRDAIAAELNELSNSEDAMAEDRSRDAIQRRFARRAAASLAVLFGKVVR